MHALAANGPGPMNSMMPMGGHHTIDILIPGNKVGLIIGKGGETIKGMQERSQCKIIFTQDISIPSDQEKSLRITGEPSKVEVAKKLVTELIYTDRSMGGGGGGGGGMQNQFGQRNVIDSITIPRSLVGMVIGKGGDMIRRIQDEHCVRLQFDQDNKVSPERVCTVTGPPDRVKEAVDRVNELMDSDRDHGNFGAPRRNMGGGGMNGPSGDGRQETSFPVPVEKCGLVIGKNGVTITEIKQTSGAHVEIQRNQPDNLPQKMFTIIGDPHQTARAIELISLKIGQPAPEQNNPYQQTSPYQSTPPVSQPTQYGQGWGDAAAYSFTGQQPYSQQPTAAPVGDAGAAAAAAAAATSSEWTAYYAAQAQAANYWGATAAQQPQPTPAPTAQAVTTDATSQPNFTQAWYEYYVNLGLYEHANMLLQQQQQQDQAGPR